MMADLGGHGREGGCRRSGDHRRDDTTAKKGSGGHGHERGRRQSGCHRREEGHQRDTTVKKSGGCNATKRPTQFWKAFKIIPSANETQIIYRVITQTPFVQRSIGFIDENKNLQVIVQFGTSMTEVELCNRFGRGVTWYQIECMRSLKDVIDNSKNRLAFVTP